jgi:hypothetical protein
MSTVTLERNERRFVFDSNTNPGVTWSTRIGAPAAGGGATGGMAWDPILEAVADNATETMVQPGAAYIIPRTSNENRALLNCTDLLASPGVPALVLGASVTESTGTQTTYGPSVYVPVSQPGWVGDITALLGAITITDYSGTPATLVFDEPSVTITLDEDYGTALAVLLAIVAQFDGATVSQLPTIIQSTTGSTFTAALKTTATGAAAVFTFNEGASTAGEITTWFANTATYIDGWTDYPVGLGGLNIGTGELGALTTTHLWTDDRDMDYVHFATLVSLDGETVQATCYKFRPEALSFSPSNTANWPEYNFDETPANFNVAQALNILAARSVGGGGEGGEIIVASNYTVQATDALVIAVDPGDFSMALTDGGGTPFTGGHEVEFWGWSPADSCMVTCDLTLYDQNMDVIGYNPRLETGQVLRFRFFIDGDDNRAWRLVYDSRTGITAPSATTVGKAVEFGSTDGKTLREANLTGPGGRPVLNEDGVWDDNLHGTSIARDSEVVKKALYDANTVLAATSDDTPAAVTVAEQTLVGRITGGDIAALTASQVRTLLALVIGTDVEAHDADLSAIAALSPSNDDVLQRKAGAWTNRTIAQLLADLAIPDEITTVRQAAGTNQTLGTSAVALASLSCPALATGDKAVLEAWGSITNSTGGTVTYTPSIKFGSTTLLSTGGTISSGTTMNWLIRATIVATSTGAQEVLIETFVNNSNTPRFNIASMTETTTGAVTLDAQITSGSSSTSQTGVRKQGFIEVTRA